MSHQILPNLISQIFQLIPPLHPFVSILALITYHPPPHPLFFTWPSPLPSPTHLPGPGCLKIGPCLSPTQTLLVTSDCPQEEVQTSQLTVGLSSSASLLSSLQPQAMPHSPPLGICICRIQPRECLPFFPLLLKLLILSGLRATILCLPSQASQFLYFRPLYRLSLL